MEKQISTYIDLKLTIMDDFYKVLSDETRLRCLTLIFENDGICVCELIHALELPQSKISRHLSIIRLNGLINQKRKGQWVFYSVNPELSNFKKNIITISIEELKNSDPYKGDKLRLNNMVNKPPINKGMKCV